MKHLRVTARVDPEQAPEFFNLLANSPDVAEARVLDVNTTLEGTETFLFAIHGDPTAFENRAGETPGVESVEVSDRGPGPAYALLVMRPLETPLFAAIHRSGSHAGIVIRMPIIYRDGNMYGRAVGDPEPLQRGLEETPDGIDVQVDEVGRFRGRLVDPTARLSDRQRETVEVAQELGYYDQPRAATHEDIADVLGCAPATASDHLQKAEAKLVTAALDDFGAERRG